MHSLVEAFPLRQWSHVAAIILIGAGAAGCSADSTRFSQDPFSNPYASSGAARSEVTGSVASPSSASSSRIEQRPLASPATAPNTAAAAPYQHNAQYGGAPAASAPATRMASTVPAPMIASATSAGTTHVVQPGETLMSLGRRYGKSRIEIARANNLPYDYRVQVGQKLVIPGVRASQASAPQPPKAQSPQSQPASVKPATAPPAGARPKGGEKVASVEATAGVNAVHPAKDDDAEASPSGPAQSFRWPVRGRVIAGFGPKPNGQQNDGINLAVPEGTSIKASDDGVVAYAGSELKGYGNLVLVRHNNGYVTAYAHASELLVKRGDQIKRGQIIARAGQTGNVTSPQLHFEIRKGKEPVDPIQYLSGG